MAERVGLRTGDKEFFILGGVTIFAILVWAYLSGRLQAVNTSLPSYSFGQPGIAVQTPGDIGTPYGWTNPGFPDPSSLPQPTPIDINVQGQPIGYLAPYFPLFGFVGVDSTMIFQ